MTASTIRPRPERSFKDRTYAVALTPDSAVSAAEIGARMIVFSQKSWDEQGRAYDGYRERFAKAHGTEAGPLLTCDFIYCDTDATKAEETARGYESYGRAVDLLTEIGLEAMCEGYLAVQAWGTPDQVIERLRDRRNHVGDYDLNLCFRYAGMPVDDAAASMATFTSEVMPALAD